MGVIQKKNPKHNHKSYFFVTRRGSGGEGFLKALLEDVHDVHSWWRSQPHSIAVHVLQEHLRPPPGLLFTGVLYILGQSYFMHVQFFSAGNRH